MNDNPDFVPSMEDKLDAARRLNEHWAKASAMEPGPKRERYLGAVKRASAKVAELYDMPMEGEGPLDKVAKVGLRAMNYGAGVVQAPILAGAEAVAGPPGKWKQVLENAVDPRTPNVTAGEVAQDVGIPPGPSLSDVVPGYAPAGSPGMWPPSKGGMLDPTARGAGAAAFDFAVSPGGYKALMQFAPKAGEKLSATELQAIEKAARESSIMAPTAASRAATALQVAADPLGEGVARGSRNLYNSAFRTADKLVTDEGSRPISDLMYRNNIWGTPYTISEKAQDLGSRLGQGVKTDLATAYQTNPNLTVPRDAIVARANQELEHSMGIAGQAGGAAEAGQRLEQEFADAYGTRGKPGATEDFNLNQLQDIKKSMQGKAAQQRAYENSPPNPSRGIFAGDSMAEAAQMGDAYKAAGNRARRAVENLADEAEPGLGGQIYRKNSDLSTLAEGQDILNKNAVQSLGTTWNKTWPASATTAMLGGGAAYGMGYHDPYAMALGAGVGAMASSTAARTGLGLLGAKSTPWGTNAIRVYLEQKYNPWIRNHEPFDVQGQ